MGFNSAFKGLREEIGAYRNPNFRYRLAFSAYATHCWPNAESS